MKISFGMKLCIFAPLILAPDIFPNGVMSAEANTSPNNSLPSLEYDVIVVGGGYSGLMSAYELQQAGLKTLVLEARDRVGGKVRSQTLRSGPGIIELGATWINNKTQPAVFGLTEKFGLKTLEQYTKGDSVMQTLEGDVLRIPPGIQNTQDPASALQNEFIGLIVAGLEKIDIRNSTSFPEKEDVSFRDWIALKGLWEYPQVQDLASELTSSIVGREPDEVGAHYFLDYIKSGGGLESLLTEGQDGAQSLMVERGTQSIATSLVDAMSPGSVLLNTPVTSITQTNNTSHVQASGDQIFTAKKVVVAVTPHMYADIEFVPPLPCEKNVLVARMKPGVYAKIILTYAEPWWRTAGLVGKFTSSLGPIRFSWEISNPALSQYSLAMFIGGDTATCWHAQSGPEKDNKVVEHLATLVGKELAPKARDVLEINYVEWTKEKYILGAPTAALGPGILRKYGAALREPFVHVHFAGTELAYEWKGYLEGAITSGQRAAKEVIDTFPNKV